MTEKKKVLIIGAGPSGLVALKEVLEAGHNPLCLDAKPQIGGLFRVSYDELYTTTTNMFLAFSDFPPPNNGGVKYWTKDEYLQYLEDYIDHFQLRKYIKLNTAVKHCVLNHDTGRWQILTKDWISTPGEMRRGSITLSDELPVFLDNDVPFNKRASYAFRRNVAPSFTYDADYLIVASGTNQVPRIPPNLSPEKNKSRAKIIHSADFTNAQSICKGKNVLVIGSGESASDVAAQSTDVAEHVTMYSRRDFDLAPRFISQFLQNGAYNEREMLHNQHQQQNMTPYDMLEGITNNRILTKLPVGLFSLALDAMLSDVTKAHGEDSTAGVLAKIGKKNFRQDFFAFDTSAPTKSGGVLAHAVACRGLDILISRDTMDFVNDGHTARFQNVSFLGKEEKHIPHVDVDVDLIILCTGFTLDFHWIDVDSSSSSPDMQLEANPRKWFKHCFPPGLGDKVAFLGYARPAQGGIPQCSELLARYVALLLSGQRQLPDDYAAQAIIEGQLEEQTFYATPHATSLVEFPAFSSSVARLIGCEPSSLYLLLGHPSRWAKYWTLPQWVYFYRLHGPGANPNVCWQVVDPYRITDTLVPMPLLILFFLFGTLMQPLLLLEYLIHKLFDHTPSQLPYGYKWRIGGHFFQLSGNQLRWQDIVLPSSGWLLLQLGFLFAIKVFFSSTSPLVTAVVFGCLGTFILISSKR